MLALATRLFSLFSFKSKRSLVVTLALIAACLALYPVFVKPALGFLTLGPRLDFVAKANAVDKAKIKEAAVKAEFERVLDDAAPPARAAAAAVPAPVAIKDIFDGKRIGFLLGGAAVWVIMGIVGLLADGAKLGVKFGTFAWLLAVGFGCGVASEFVVIPWPFAARLAAFAFAEVVLIGVIGTLLQIVNARGRG